MTAFVPTTLVPHEPVAKIIQMTENSSFSREGLTKRRSDPLQRAVYRTVMIGVRLFQNLLLAFASLAYLANGAQAHVTISESGQIDLMLCSTGAAKTITIDLPTEPAEETQDTACGDCAPAAAILVEAPDERLGSLHHRVLLSLPLIDHASPRSPLWPGAPPHGPPSAHKTKT